MSNRVEHIIKALALLVLFVPAEVRAQYFDFDVASVEATINDHRRVRSILIVRSTLEQANQVLHKQSSEGVVDYRNLNKELDKYTRCFDLIDLIFSSGKTVVNTVATYNDVKDKIQDLKQLNERYVSKCLSKGNVEPSDSLIIRIYLNMIGCVSNDVEGLIRSLYDLALYASGGASCTTPQLIGILDRINYCLNDIRGTVSLAQYQLWKYITIRTTYWKRELYVYKRKYELYDSICDSAFIRWRKARYMLFEVQGAIKTLSQRNAERGN